MSAHKRYRYFKIKVMGLCRTLDRLDLVDSKDMVILKEEKPKAFFSRFLMKRVEKVKGE